jgi:hypothetical protein
VHGALAATAVGASALIVFSVLSLASFGSGALSWDFAKFLLEPFFIYGGGFGGWAVDWSLGWPLLYNVVAPGLCLATLGWALSNLRKGGQYGTSRLAALALLACTSIMLSAKYWNMSIFALWHVNSLGFLAVIAWWAREWMRRSELVRLIGAGMLALAALALVGFADDPRNPSDYGIRAYLKYPAAMLEPFKRNKPPCRKMACAAPEIAKEDVALIASLIPPTGRAAILDWNDWAYLIEARRAPKFFFLPGVATFTRRQLDQSLANLDMIFVARDPEKRYLIQNPEIAEELLPVLSKEFAIVATGKRFVALARTRVPTQRPSDLK